MKIGRNYFLQYNITIIFILFNFLIIEILNGAKQKIIILRFSN